MTRLNFHPQTPEEAEKERQAEYEKMKKENPEELIKKMNIMISNYMQIQEDISKQIERLQSEKYELELMILKSKGYTYADIQAETYYSPFGSAAVTKGEIR